MLVFSRKHGEGVWIGGTLVKVSIHGANVKLGIDAPQHIRVYRQELVDGSESVDELPRMASQGGTVPELAIAE